MCQRHVSESHTDPSGPASAICRNRPAPTSIAIPNFSFFSPYVPAMPQHVASLSATSSPGMSAISSSAGLPIPWPCCWQGAW